MSIQITRINQLDLNDEALSHRYHVAILSSLQDSRSAFIHGELHAYFSRLLVIDDCASENQNFLCLARKGQEVHDVSGVCAQLLKYLESPIEGDLRIFIDVSSLSRRSMGELFACVKTMAEELSIDLTVGYSLARYVSPPDRRFPVIRRLGPVHHVFAGWGAPASWPVDVVVSLGYEEGKALGAVEYLEPRNRWVFVPNSPEERFLRDVKNHNKQLLKYGDSVFDYDLTQPVETYFRLLSLLTGLTVDTRAILLPFGPKLFFAVSLLVAASMNKVAVWHVDGDDEMVQPEMQAAGSAVFLNCMLSTRSDVKTGFNLLRHD